MPLFQDEILFSSWTDTKIQEYVERGEFIDVLDQVYYRKRISSELLMLVRGSVKDVSTSKLLKIPFD